MAELSDYQDALVEAEAEAAIWKWCVEHPYDACLLFCEATNRDTYGAEEMSKVPGERVRQFIRERVIELMEGE